MEEARTPKIWDPIDFTVYFSFIKWPVILFIILELAFRIFSNSLGAGLIFDNQEIIAWLIRLGFFVFLGYRAVNNFGPSAAVGALAGAIAGFWVGSLAAFFRFFGGFAVWKFLNLITETSLAMLVGALTLVLMIFILSFKK